MKVRGYQTTVSFLQAFENICCVHPLSGHLGDILDRFTVTIPY